MLYRPYASQDFARLYALESACFAPPARFGRSYMRQLVQSPQSATWIAEEAGQMAGFAVVVWTQEINEITAYIQTIEVAPEARRQGVGRELLNRLEESARKAGAALVWLHVEAGNGDAIRLYEARGYSHEGRQENYYPEGRAALIYAKRLDAGG